VRGVDDLRCDWCTGLPGTRAEFGRGRAVSRDDQGGERTSRPHGDQQQNFARWGEIFGDDTVAAAMIDRLVHHAEFSALKGDSYRLKNRELGRVPAAVSEVN
jgi:hypothetical protein